MTVGDWFWAGVDGAVGTLAFLGVILGVVLAVVCVFWAVEFLAIWLVDRRKAHRARKTRHHGRRR